VDRRAFFRHGLRKVSRAAVEGAEQYTARRARRWIRPPYALDELEFLLACTRCGECLEVCPNGVIFGLSTRLGAQVAATPALDLLHKGCHLCRDWPCVNICEPQALKSPESNPQGEPPPPPILALAEIDSSACLPYAGPECGACRGSCPIPGALQWRLDKPHIVRELCVGCALCREACIVEPKAIRIRSRYAEDDEPRPA